MCGNIRRGSGGEGRVFARVAAPVRSVSPTGAGRARPPQGGQLGIEDPRGPFSNTRNPIARRSFRFPAAAGAGRGPSGGRALVVFGKVGHRPHVGFDRVRREVPQANVFDQPLPKGCHRSLLVREAIHDAGRLATPRLKKECDRDGHRTRPPRSGLVQRNADHWPRRRRAGSRTTTSLPAGSVHCIGGLCLRPLDGTPEMARQPLCQVLSEILFHYGEGDLGVARRRKHASCRAGCQEPV